MLVDNVVILFCTKIETMVIVLVIRFYMQIGKGTFNVNFFFGSMADCLMQKKLCSCICVWTTQLNKALVTSAVALKFSFQDLGGKVAE